ncbi:importin-9 [Anaeramoeba flamelloides]|uniref:Importin-9 n=1 Tax=Anaeramoeba flamelloides TaxID=1746091 RepID=A0AAV7Z4P3_9EUKA|nr:importin-9 [Anaeramoeba flamelloides]
MTNLRDLLSGILSGNNTLRLECEEKIVTLSEDENFCINLLEYSLNENESLANKQLSLVLLRDLIGTTFDLNNNKEKKATIEVRSTILDGLLNNLSIEERLIRRLISACISKIGQVSSFESRLQLVEILIERILNNNDPNLLIGCLNALDELILSLTKSEEILQIGSTLLKIFLEFIQNSKEKLEPKAISQTISTVGRIFSKLKLVDDFSEEFSNNLSQLFFQYLKFFQNDINNFQIDSKSNHILTIQCVKQSLFLFSNFTIFIENEIYELFVSIYKAIQNCVEVYNNEIIDQQNNNNNNNNNNNENNNNNKAQDEEGNLIGLEILISFFLEFFHSIVFLTPNLAAEFFESIIEETIQMILIYMKITKQNEIDWIETPDLMLEKESEEYSYGVRFSSYNLLCELIDQFKESVPQIMKIVENELNKLVTMENNNTQSEINNWKNTESLLFAIYSISRLNLNQLFNSNKTFINNLVLIIEKQSQKIEIEQIFLTRRIFLLCSKFSKYINNDLLNKLYSHSINLLKDSTQSSIVHLACIGFINGSSNYINDKEVKNFGLNLVYKIICESLDQVDEQTREFLLICLIECIPKEMEPIMENIEILVDSLIVTWVDCLGDELTQDLCSEALKKIIALPNSIINSKVIIGIAPTCIKLLQNYEKNDSGITFSTIQLIRNISQLKITNKNKNENENEEKKQFTEKELNSFKDIFFLLIEIILKTSNNECIVQSLQCLRTLISILKDYIVEWEYEELNGVQLLLKIILFLLKPEQSESSIILIGPLIRKIISDFQNSISEHLEDLLVAIIDKLKNSQTSSLIESLIIVLAKFIEIDQDSVVKFLVDNQHLQYIIGLWCSVYNMFLDDYEFKISLIGLSTLLQMSFTNEQLSNCLVEQIPSNENENGNENNNNRVVKKNNFVKFPIKALTILTDTLMEKFGENLQKEGMQNYLDENQNSLFDNPFVAIDNEFGGMDYLQDLHSQFNDENSDLYDEEFLNETSGYDFDQTNDPIFKLNLIEYIQDVLKMLAQQNFDQFKELINQLPVECQEIIEETFSEN